MNIIDRPRELEKRQAKKALRDQLMTDDQQRFSRDIIAKYKVLFSENQTLYSLWDRCEAAYRGISTDYTTDDSTLQYDTINLVHPNIEGQVAALVEQNIGVATRGETPSDQNYADVGKHLLEWTLSKNNIKLLVERHERRREKFGVGLFKVFFDPEAINKFGLATITCPSLKKVFVDGKIKDHLKIQEGDYIIETMEKSILWAERKYGKEKASAIDTGINSETLEFSENSTQDDSDAFTYLQVWMMDDGILRVVCLSGDGLILEDSFDDGKRKPYYKHNKYPYFITPLYPIEGSLYAMGDAELLMPLQALINELDAQIVTNVKLLGNPITFIDPDSEVDIDKITNEEGLIIPCVDPHKNVLFVDRKAVNDGVISRKQQCFSEAQRATRFSDVMNGIGGTDKTATEAMIQQQQGNSAVDHKKKILQVTLNDMAHYLLSLMIEFYTEGKAFRLTGEKAEFKWIDPRDLGKIPITKPVSETFKNQFKAENGVDYTGDWQNLTDAAGKEITKSVELDIDITIGAGLPKNKSFLFQLLKDLSQITIEDKSIFGYDEFRKMLKELIDLPLEDQQQIPQLPPQMLQGMPQGALPPSSMVGTPQMPSPDSAAVTAQNVPAGAAQGGILNATP